MIKPTQQLVSIDTSVWIEYFKAVSKKNFYDLDELICDNLAAVCEPVIAELLVGTNSQRQYRHHELLMRANIILETPDAIWENLATARYKLLRMGFHASFLDLWVAYSAYYARTYLWTLDQDFKVIQKVVPFEFYQDGS